MGLNVEVKIYPGPKKVVKAFAKKINKIINETNQQRFDIALSGGKTPKLLFKVLSEKYADKLPWHKIHFWWGDERCVSPENVESNYGLAIKYLISRIPIPTENIHRIKGEASPVEEANNYSRQINDQLNMRGEWPVFDLIYLGMGSDGHTASIFPDQLKLIDHNRNCAVAKHPATGQKRITITGKVINNANRVYMLVTGKQKALRISDIMNNEESAKLLPAYHIEPENGELIWYLDEDAASLIS